MATELGREYFPGFADAAIRQMTSYDWPGNLRELKNVVERAVYRTDAEAKVGEIVLDPFDSPYRPRDEPVRTSAPAPPALPLDLKQAVRDFETERVHAAMDRARHNQRKAAERGRILRHQQFGTHEALRIRLRHAPPSTVGAPCARTWTRVPALTRRRRESTVLADLVRLAGHFSLREPQERSTRQVGFGSHSYPCRRTHASRRPTTTVPMRSAASFGTIATCPLDPCSATSSSILRIWLRSLNRP